MRILHSVLLLLMPLATSQAVAQDTGRLAGRVADDLGNPLPGANVVVEDTYLGAAADIDGNYLIIGVPSGEYEVTVSCREYRARFDERIVVSLRQTTVQHFEITIPEKERLDPCFRKSFCGVCLCYDCIVKGGRVIWLDGRVANLPVRGVVNLGREVYEALSPKDRERIAELINAYEQSIASGR